MISGVWKVCESAASSEEEEEEEEGCGPGSGADRLTHAAGTMV